MLKNIIKTVMAILAISMIQSVVISHQDEDIRQVIFSNMQDKPKKDLFRVYHLLFEKKYDLNTEEGLKRYKIFKQNLKFIENFNTERKSFRLGITPFTDMTNEEFKTQLGGKIENIKKFQGFEFNENPDVLPNSTQDDTTVEQTPINWTSKMNSAKQQGACGSCWAFATVAAIEGNYNVKFNKALEFSQQQLVDCDLANYGCEGGFPTKALDYIQTNGIAYYNAYTYISGSTGQRDACKQSTTIQNLVVKGYEECPHSDCSRSKYFSYLAKGPMIIHMDGDGKSAGNAIFQHYTGGVIDATMTCSEVNHAIVAVGYDKDDQGEYLIGRNSWGTGWGEKGNFRIRMRTSDNTCYMQDLGYLPVMEETMNPVPPPVVPGCLKLYSECYFKGQTKEICGNTPKIENFTKIAGYELGKYPSAKIFLQSENCRGSYYSLGSSYSCFSTDGLSRLVNSVKSILVDETSPPTGCVWLFSGNCLSGDKVEICSNTADLNAAPFKFGNKTSSIKIGPGIKSVTFYLNPKYSGSYSTITLDILGMAGQWMDKEIESIKITK